MAAQYDVNLEKCALLKCLCGAEARLLQDRLRCAHLLLKSPSFLVIQIKVAEYIFRICKNPTFICVHSE